MQKPARALFAVAVGFLVVLPAHGEGSEPVDQPRVIAYGKFEGGGFAFCLGVECAQAVASLGDKTPYEQMRTLQPEQGMDREAFCGLMEDQQPENCDATDPPSTPGLDQNWQGNGCGTSGYSNLFLDSGIGSIYSDNYSGNFQAPFPGVSFRSSCNGHDACWGVAGNRATCDNAFHESMTSACGAVAAASSRTVCNAFAAVYFSAVAATDTGNDNYRQSVANRRCALWVYDMNNAACEIPE